MEIEVKLNPEKPKQFPVLYKPWFIDVKVVRDINIILQMVNDSKARKIFIENRSTKNVTAIIIYINNTSSKALDITDGNSYEIMIYNIHGKPLGGCGLKVDMLKPHRIIVEPGQKKFYRFFILEYISGVSYTNGGYCYGKPEPGKYIFKISLQTRPHISIGIVIEIKSH